LEPESAEELDDLLIEYRYGVDGAGPVTKGVFEHLVAAVERILPHYKGLLCLCKAEISQWRVVYTVRHSVPLIPQWALVLAYGFLHLGLAPVGALVLLQSLTGRRPSEAMGLNEQHVILPSPRITDTGAGSLLHGVKSGTKANRPQSVRVTHPLALLMMGALKCAAPAGGRLTHLLTLGGLSYVMSKAAEVMRLNHLGWKPHSGRSGFVTWRSMQGDRPEAIMAVTRHVALASFRTYLDVTAVAAGKLALELESRRDLLDFCAQHVPRMLVQQLLSSSPFPRQEGALF
jgi:hypothetical protein